MAATSGRLTRFYFVLGGLALIGGVGLWYAAQNRGAADPAVAAAVPAAVDDGFTGYAKGAEDAPVEVVEYSDFQCPFCAQFAVVQLPDIDRRLIATGRVRWRFRDFPLDNAHPHARIAARAAQCAGEQGRFWEMHDALLWRQREWASLRDARSKFEEYAREIGVDRGAFRDCFGSTKYDGRVQASLEEGRGRGVGGTPTLFVNGRNVGAVTADELVRMVDSIAPLQ